MITGNCSSVKSSAPNRCPETHKYNYPLCRKSDNFTWKFLQFNHDR